MDPDRVNVYEEWESEADAAGFGGSGPTDEQSALIPEAVVAHKDDGVTAALTSAGGGL